MNAKELSEKYGSLDLLAAYIMRTANVDEETAFEWLYDVDSSLERMLEDRKDKSEYS